MAILTACCDQCKKPTTSMVSLITIKIFECGFGCDGDWENNLISFDLCAKCYEEWILTLPMRE